MLGTMVTRVSLRIIPIVLLSMACARAEVEVVYQDEKSCYESGQAKACKPPLMNLAEDMPVETTSECGHKNLVEDVCRRWTDDKNRTRSFCQKCHKKYESLRRSADILTMSGAGKDGSCWTSDYIYAKEGQNQVNLTISFGKRFEVNYVSLSACGELPDSIAIFKSADFGRSWKPWHYFSTDCYRAFGLPTSHAEKVQISFANIQEVLCMAFPKNLKYNEFGQASIPIPFGTTAGRPVSSSWNAALNEWTTATDVKLSLIRFPDAANQARSPSFSLPGNVRDVFRLGDSSTGAKVPRAVFPTALDRNAVRFALSGITIGGRCECNGHSNRCVRDITRETDSSGKEIIKRGRLRCDCQHGTEGADCERCAPGFLDRPWAAGTEKSAAECRKCLCSNHASECKFSVKAFKASGGRSGGVCLVCRHNTQGHHCDECIDGYTRNSSVSLGHPDACRECDCNLHSNNCTFSEELYASSRHKTGGSCINCQHNTTGQKCQQCTENFYRDWTKPMSHERACKPCQCHPVGSKDLKQCDRRTGQCTCKEGVTGLTCDHCASGYQQTNSHDKPCIHKKENYALRPVPSSPYRVPTPTYPSMRPNVMQFDRHMSCPSCEPEKKRFGIRRFCRQQTVFMGEVNSFEQYPHEIRYEVTLHDIWRVKDVAKKLLPEKVTAAANKYPVWISITRSTAQCFCPQLELGKRYLFAAKVLQKPHNSKLELQLDAGALVLPWQDNWRRRMERFRKRDQRGVCDRFSRGTPSKMTERSGRRRLRDNSRYYPNANGRYVRQSYPNRYVPRASHGYNNHNNYQAYPNPYYTPRHSNM